MTRAFSDGLHKLPTNTAFPLDWRKVLTEVTDGVSRTERLTKGVRSAMIEASQNKNAIQACGILKQDLMNSVFHVWVNHYNCRNTYCKRKDAGDADVTHRLISAKMMVPIKKLLDRLVRNADRLVFNTTNQAERYVLHHKTTSNFKLRSLISNIIRYV